MAVYGKQFREKIGSNDSCLETWREFYNVLLETTLVDLSADVRTFAFWWWLFKSVLGARRWFEDLGVRATTCAIFVPLHMTHAKLHSNISVFFGQMNDTHVEEKIKSSAGGGLFNLVPGVMNTFGVLVTRATTRAIFVAFNMLQAKLHFNISVFLVVQWTIPHVEQQRQFNMRVYEGVVKGWDQFLVWSFVLFY
jgi:hypothetical protein